MLEELQRFHRFVATHPVTRQSRLGAWRRWARWQLASRILDAPVIFPWLDESLLVVERGMTGATGNLYCGLHEFADMALLLHYFCGKQGVFLDVGANIGSYTILASKVSGVFSIAIEPAPATFRKLQRNIAVNGIGELVEAHCMVAGSKAESILFSDDRDTMNQVVDVSYAGNSVAVPVGPLDDIFKGRSAGFWKVDVEGFEHEVLAGAMNSLNDRNVDIVLLEGHDPEIAQRMNSAGFQKQSYDPFHRRFTGCSTFDQTNNNVWVKNLKAVADRCRSAPKRTLHGVEF